MVLFALMLYPGLHLPMGAISIRVQRNTSWSTEFSYWLRLHLVFGKQVKQGLCQLDPITNRGEDPWVEISSQSSS